MDDVYSKSDRPVSKSAFFVKWVNALAVVSHRRCPLRLRCMLFWSFAAPHLAAEFAQIAQLEFSVCSKISRICFKAFTLSSLSMHVDFTWSAVLPCLVVYMFTFKFNAIALRQNGGLLPLILKNVCLGILENEEHGNRCFFSD